jgi:23S rRNA pseudouridine1911/1915/1917 synthase
MGNEPPAERVELVVEADADTRLDSYLAEALDTSRSRVEQWIADGRVRLNGEVPLKRMRPRAGDRLVVELPAPAPSPLAPEDIPLDVVYEDADLLVLDKPAGLVVHPAPGHAGGTLVNALLHRVDDLSGIGGVLRPGIVHRLDKDTSGLMIVAKHDAAHRRLAAALQARRIRRRYLTLVWGHLPADTLTVDAPIGRHPTERKRMAVVEGGRSAVTHFERLERWPAADLVRAQLETGRTHQIRVHLQHLGHPVVGDAVYGAGRERGISGPARRWAQTLARKVPRQFLHAAELELEHPRTGAALSFTAGLPADLAAVAEWARGASGPVA